MKLVSISSNHKSVDDQIEDAMDYLANWGEDWNKVVNQFPEWRERVWEEPLRSHFDTEAMGVNEEWASWLIEAIEATGRVKWEDDEPWGVE